MPGGGAQMKMTDEVEAVMGGVRMGVNVDIKRTDGKWMVPALVVQINEWTARRCRAPAGGHHHTTRPPAALSPLLLRHNRKTNPTVASRNPHRKKSRSYGRCLDQPPCGAGCGDGLHFRPFFVTMKA